MIYIKSAKLPLRRSQDEINFTISTVEVVNALVVFLYLDCLFPFEIPLGICFGAPNSYGVPKPKPTTSASEFPSVLVDDVISLRFPSLLPLFGKNYYCLELVNRFSTMSSRFKKPKSVFLTLWFCWMLLIASRIFIAIKN